MISLNLPYPLDRTFAPLNRGSILLILSVLLLYVIYTHVVRPLTSPLRALRYPPGGTGIAGHFAAMVDYYNGPEIDRWVEDLGPTFMVRGLFFVEHRLFTLDPRAVQHIMSQPYLYGKPGILRRVLKRYMKDGLIVSEGHRHKIQRKVTQKLFSSGGLRDMAEVVQRKTDELIGIMEELCADPKGSTPFATLPTPPGTIANTRVIDMYDSSSRLTYDMIGEIAIDHSFESLSKPHGPGGELFHKYERMQQVVPGSQGLRQDLSVLIPGLDKIWPTENSRRVDAAMDPLEVLARGKVEARKREMEAGNKSDGRDLLTLQWANIAKGTPPDMQLLDTEITGQLATFLFAGSDTTAGTLAWALHHLSRNNEVQSRLRTECLGYGEGLPYEQMDLLPYLDAVVKETLRTNPSIPSTIRKALQDDVLPLAIPIVLKSGETLSSIKVRKGQYIHIPIENLNMARSIWGPDSRSFNPSRWLSLDSPDQDKHPHPTFTLPDGPGVWPNVMTFIDGPRRCVGYKLALMEMKITLFTLVRVFIFVPVEGKRVYKWNLFSTRPYVNGELHTKGSSLPLLVRPYKG